MTPEEPGEPLHLLAEQEHETSEEFIHRLRRRIHRRSTARHFALFSWDMPQTILRELAEFAGYFTRTVGGGKEPRS